MLTSICDNKKGESFHNRLFYYCLSFSFPARLKVCLQLYKLCCRL